MNKREEIARAICVADGWDPDSPFFECPGAPGTEREALQWETYLAHAGAVLDALKEPTEEMVLAACEGLELPSHRRRIFRAMIQAAKDGK